MRIVTKSLVAALLMTLVSGVTNAGLIDNNTVTIIDSTGAYPGYPAGDALDTGANKYLTDYASLGGGSTAHLDFDFGAAVTFGSIQFTGRTSSGGANESYARGVTDFVTRYEYIFSNNADLSSPIATVVSPLLTPPPGPAGSLSYLDFQSTLAIPNITARYVEWRVLSNLGPGNTGAADFAFQSVPEPSSLALLSLGGLGLAIGAYRRRRATV